MAQQRQRKERQAGAKQSTAKAKATAARRVPLQQQQQRRERQAVHSTGWTRKSFQRTRIRERRRIQDTTTTQKRRKGAKGKHASNVCYRCGQPGHMANDCRAANYTCDTGNFDTNDQTDDWYNQAHCDSNRHNSKHYHKQQTQQQYPSQDDWRSTASHRRQQMGQPHD